MAAVLTLLPAMAAAKPGIIQVTSVRAWSHPDSTRIIVETTGPFEYRADNASNPERLFFDVLHATPWIAHRRYATEVVNDALVVRVRIAETAPGTTRIVFDLTGPATYKVSRLEAPDRMVIEIRPRVPAHSGAPVFIDPPVPLIRSRGVILAGNPPLLDPAPLPSSNTLDFVLKAGLPKPPKPARNYAASTPAAAPVVAAPRPMPYDPKLDAPLDAKLDTRPDPVPALPPARDAARDLTPHASENGARSLTRALGLKVNRIVIDAGHGGHDDGTIGPNGVLEKDVVLDVALRLAKLVQSRMGAEVVLTRSDDTFIPLNERTAIANQRKADLFLSIHANSSPAPSVAGTETFFLNFSNSPGALDVASRENAGADKSVGELMNLIQTITLNDKITESETFAQTVQSTLFAQAAKSNASARNRGVKKAPFVVLIGAQMPSILAEIGFLSNARDEANLNKPEYRQKIAEAIFRGLSQYSQSLSHFEVARDSGKAEKPVGVGLN
ncbi:MAG: N-acetylmuramoyl-L-alanine amidase [Bryobacteraceae bacterium]